VRAVAIVPVKRFAEAKQRLASGLDEASRQALAAAMLGDVLEAIAAARTVDRTVLVSGDPLAQEIAAETTGGVEVVPDPADEGHNVAARAGIARAEAEGASCAVLLPGDCPLLAPRDLDRLLTGVPARYAGIVPDRHGSGTNALVLSPPDAIEPSFGEGSRERHVAAARAAGVPFEVEEVPSLGLDLDTLADLVALTRELEAHRGAARRTAKALGL
jgi:2-phospho-L-lactate/phosphoenolpyruvate guanylyltransferase